MLFTDYLINGKRSRVECADALTFLQKVKSNSASIIFLDPPFNLNKTYSKTISKLDTQDSDNYFLWLCRILDESIRVLKPGGSLYLYHLPIWAVKFGSYLSARLLFRHWISVSMKNGFVRGNFLYPAHYALLYYTKGKPRYFSRPKIKPMQCKKCGANIKDYGGYKSIIEKQGINLSDIWEDTSPVRHANRKKRAANELPPIIYERIFEISGKANTKFVEPFAGTGTGAIVAIKRKMSFLLCDLVEENYNLIINRISSELP